jgi:hypothetical protein
MSSNEVDPKEDEESIQMDQSTQRQSSNEKKRGRSSSILEQQINTVIIPDENENHSQDDRLPTEALDLNIDNPLQPSNQQESQVIKVAEQASEEAKTAAAIAATIAIEDVKLEEETKVRLSNRPRRKSGIMLDIESQKQEEQKRKEQEKALQEAKALQEKNDAEKAANIVDQPLSQVSLGWNDSNTIAYATIIKKTRLETYDATSQAKTIFKYKFDEITKPESKCFLCGFQLKHRISWWHNNIHGYNPQRLTWSYDHFVPVNFSAVMFRIPVAKGGYGADELKLLEINGGIACFHCNYEKSQRMFITCPKEGGDVDFNKYEPNEPSIKEFFEDLYTSKNKNGWADEKGNRTLIKCLPKYLMDKNTWIRERTSAIVELAKKVCEVIKTKVDRSKVETRIKLTRVLVQKAKDDLTKDQKYMTLTSNEAKLTYARNYTAKLFGAAELTFPSPWRDGVIAKGNVQSMVNIFNTKKGGSYRRRRNTNKNKRKTYRRIKLF